MTRVCFSVFAARTTKKMFWLVFKSHPRMLLKRDHLVSWRINWRQKSENLKALSDELHLGLDSFIFIDDDPIECAEVRAHCPQVLTIELPEIGKRRAFLEHVWAFDQLSITSEGRKRTALYQQNALREDLQRESLTFQDFFPAWISKWTSHPSWPTTLHALRNSRIGRTNSTSPASADLYRSCRERVRHLK